MGWANRITVVRGFLTVALWIVLLVGAPAPSTATWWVALALFFVTAVTDAVDGYIARRFGDVSVFGRIADPLVDKLLVLGTMVVLLTLDGIPAILPAWAVVIMLARELLVTALRGAVEGKGVSFQAMPLGKYKMVVQCLALGAVMLWGAGLGLAREPVPGLGALLGPHWNVPHVLVWLATLLTALSGVDYGFKATRLLLR